MHRRRDLGIEELITSARDSVIREHANGLSLMISNLFLMIGESIENLDRFHTPILFVIKNVKGG
ncbi:hypothetical protein ACWGE0_01945 [Lentzea sp. NPDC054927]